MIVIDGMFVHLYWSGRRGSWKVCLILYLVYRNGVDTPRQNNNMNHSRFKSSYDYNRKLWNGYRKIIDKIIYCRIYLYRVVGNWWYKRKGVILREKRNRKYRIKIFHLRLCFRENRPSSRLYHQLPITLYIYRENLQRIKYSTVDKGSVKIQIFFLLFIRIFTINSL